MSLDSNMTPGKVYRRNELVHFSSSVDRELKSLVEAKQLTKVAPGMYCKFESSRFGPVPPTDHELVSAFLKRDRFLLLSPSDFTKLGLGFTQLYPYTIVLNRKRHGEFKLAGRRFKFVRPPEVPTELTKEVLLVNVVGLHRMFSETLSLDVLRQHLGNFDLKLLDDATQRYGNEGAKSFLLPELIAAAANV